MVRYCDGQLAKHEPAGNQDYPSHKTSCAIIYTTNSGKIFLRGRTRTEMARLRTDEALYVVVAVTNSLVVAVKCCSPTARRRESACLSRELRSW